MANSSLDVAPLGLALLAAAPTIARADTVVLPTFDALATAPAGASHVDVTKVPDRIQPIGDDEAEPCPDL
jgi:hypothetical protein